jgi:hypothetical protein
MFGHGLLQIGTADSLTEADKIGSILLQQLYFSKI